LAIISELAQEYNYVGMDTEFPGDVYYHEDPYEMLKENINNLKLIQLGITLSNESGEYAEPICTWQFNFKFDLQKEPFNKSSIDLLKRSGINFEMHNAFGIDIATFAEYFLTSGLICNPDIHWYGFHTDHDFAYILRALSNEDLPAT